MNILVKKLDDELKRSDELEKEIKKNLTSIKREL